MRKVFRYTVRFVDVNHVDNAIHRRLGQVDSHPEYLVPRHRRRHERPDFESRFCHEPAR